MPDWSYQTVFRPIFAKMSYLAARTIAFRSIGLLGSNAIGRTIVQLMGHMRPSPLLRTKIGDCTLASPVILSSRLDPNLQAIKGFAEFGFGLLEVGPVDLGGTGSRVPESNDHADWKRHRLKVFERSIMPEYVAGKYRPQAGQPPLLVRVRVDAQKPQPIADAWHALTVVANAFVLEVNDVTNDLAIGRAVELTKVALQEIPGLRLLLIRCDEGEFLKATEAIRQSELPALVGICVDMAVNTDSGMHVGPVSIDELCSQIQDVRLVDKKSQLPIVVRSAVTIPEDALALMNTGADAVAIDSGLVFSGPGIVKRINNAVLHQRINHTVVENSSQENRTLADLPTVSAWQWAALLGVALLGGGLVTLWIGARGVLLPYDEHYLGMSGAQLRDIAPRLISFMAHDRITLSGTMLGLGWIYLVLAWCGVRSGLHWAMKSMWWSCVAGFASFFTFLFFGYFDVLHAFISAVLLQFCIQMGQTPLGPRTSPKETCLANDRDWSFAQWGQLLLVIQAAALMVAGTVICCVASTHVFVSEDLDFLQSQPADLLKIQPNLIAVIAHDRATFGGMLLACGTAILLSTMWGFERGRAWLWWMFAVAGTVAYTTTILVHECVGYTSWWHLLPAYGGLAELWIALGCCMQYLCFRSVENEAAWNHIRRWQRKPL